MKIAKLIDIAEDIIEIGETIKNLAKEESYIDFHYRGAQLYLLANIIENAGKYYGVEAPENPIFKDFQKKWEEYDNETL